MQHLPVFLLRHTAKLTNNRMAHENRHTNRLSMSGLVLLASSLFGAAQAQNILVDSSILDQAMDVLGDKYAESAVAQEEITVLPTRQALHLKNLSGLMTTLSLCWF